MSITVSSSAVHREVTTLSRLKSELDITGSSEDPYLTDLIQECTDFLERYCNRKFAKETVVEGIQTFDDVYMLLSRTPIVSINGITEDGSTISSTSYSVRDPKVGIVYRKERWKTSELFRYNVETYPTHKGEETFQVTYIGGYAMPGGDEAVTFPKDLERACLDLIKSWYFRKGDDPMVNRQRVGDASESLYSDPDGLPPMVKMIFNKYRRYDITI